MYWSSPKTSLPGGISCRDPQQFAAERIDRHEVSQSLEAQAAAAQRAHRVRCRTGIGPSRKGAVPAARRPGRTTALPRRIPAAVQQIQGPQQPAAGAGQAGRIQPEDLRAQRQHQQMPLRVGVGHVGIVARDVRCPGSPSAKCQRVAARGRSRRRRSRSAPSGSDRNAASCRSRTARGRRGIARRNVRRSRCADWRARCVLATRPRGQAAAAANNRPSGSSRFSAATSCLPVLPSRHTTSANCRWSSW